MEGGNKIMSIDKRIVEMQFQNQQFEKGIAQSTKSLETFKNGLNMDGAVKGLNNLEKTAKSFSLASMAEGIQNISNKFSSLNVIGVTALTNLTNSALNAGKRILSAFTIDPVKTGLEEYETKIGAIQTILTNTQSKGTTLDDVTATLNELNTYADQTIYNFAEMTRNIGTFTAAGVDLKDSAIAIKGIANLAAGSGSNAQQASTAMYQLSQALAAGSVKLQDWNSVVNAGMGGELFQNALKETAKQMGIVVDAGKPFRETLQDGWLTSDVLIKTLSKFAEDETLLQAATQVKTFTQMVDTMKESVQSGWSMSWEYIIGNKDQAAELFTAINDGFSSIVGSSADARNEMLKFWNENGGRDAIIQALANAFHGLSAILTPIGKAFRELFPKTTGQQLVDVSNKIKDLSEKFKIGEETASKIQRTFKGLFAIVDIGRQAFLAIAGGLGNFISKLAPAGSGLLDITATIGDFIVKLNETIRTSNIFTKGIEKIGSIVGSIASIASKAITGLINIFKDLFNIDFGGFTSDMERDFKPFTALANLVESAFNKMGQAIEKVQPLFSGIASIIGKAFSSIQEAITGAVRNGDAKSILDLFNGGIFAAILLGVKKFIDSLSEITEGAGGLLEGVTDILDGVKGSLEAYQSQLKAGTLIKIASAIGILSAALIGLSMVDSEKLQVALVAVSVMFAELFTSMAIFEKIMSGSGFTAMGKVTTSMIALSSAVLILSGAVKNLADLEWDGLLKGLAGVGVLSGTLVVSAKSLSNSSGKLIKGSLGLIAFAAAINVLTQAVAELGVLDVASLTKGLVGVGVLMTELSLFMNATDLSKMGITKSVGILVLASSLVVMSDAVTQIATIDVAGLTKALTTMGIIFTEVSLFMNLTGGANKIISTATGMTILGGAMLIFAQAIEEMGSLSIEQIAKGLTAMGGSLGIIATAVALLPKNMISKGTGLVVIATSLNILADALNTMAESSWEEIAKSLVTLAGSLGIIAVAMAGMTTALPGASALLVISGALAVLAPVIERLGNMSLGEIGTSLLSLVGIFTVLGGTAVILGPLAPALLAVSGAIAVLGAGSLAAGAGILAFSAGLAALAVSGTAGAAALVAIVSSIISLIPYIATELGRGIVEFISILGDGAEEIAEAIGKIIISALDVIIESMPKFSDAIGAILDLILDLIIEYVPKVIDGGIKLILGLLKGIADNIQKVVETAIDVVVNFINGVASRLPQVIQAGVELILSFIEGLTDAINKNTNRMITAIYNLFSALVDAGMKVLFGSIISFQDLGVKIIRGVITGVNNTVSNFVSSVKSLINSGLSALSNGIRDFTNAGKNLINGFIDGIKSKISDVARAAAKMAKDALNAAKNVLGIHSPSREFESVGKFADEGLVRGLVRNADSVNKASENIGKSATETLRRSLSNMLDIVNGDMDLNPIIRPVLDMSDVTSGVNSFDRMLGSSGVKMSSSISANVGKSANESSNDKLLSKLLDVLSTDSTNKSTPQRPPIIFNINGGNSNPKDISRQIQRDLISYNRALGVE